VIERVDSTNVRDVSMQQFIVIRHDEMVIERLKSYRVEIGLQHQ